MERNRAFILSPLESCRRMSSAVYFKMGWEKDMSKVVFSGNQISLRDLKDQIIEMRNLNKGAHDWAFDLIVKDADDSSKG